MTIDMDIVDLLSTLHSIHLCDGIGNCWITNTIGILIMLEADYQTWMQTLLFPFMPVIITVFVVTIVG